MEPSVSYIPYATSYHEQTGDIITFAQFEEGDLVENEWNLEEEESILTSIDKTSEDNDSNDVSISKDNHRDIQDGNHVHMNITERDYILKICDQTRQEKSK